MTMGARTKAERSRHEEIYRTGDARAQDGIPSSYYEFCQKKKRDIQGCAARHGATRDR